MNTSLLLCLSLVAFFATIVSADAASDKITNLPGLPGPLNFDQYSGYITVDETAGRAIFYWFVESQVDPDNAPLVVWLTGGPGCSGLIATLGENGPFAPVESNPSTLELNPWSWNRIANVIYIESPAGVGFSYSNTTSDYNTGDVRTANDSYIFLQKFLEQFPQYQDNPFWITGESYGGHYVPNLAGRILAGNERGLYPKINIEGFMVGNAWTYMPIDNLGCITDWYTHALMPETTYEKIKKVCDLTDIGPLKRDARSAECDAAIQQSSNEMGNINIYDIYIDVCESSYQKYIIEQFARAGSPAHRQFAEAAPPNYPVDPCSDKHLTTYLNIPAVQKALHARPGVWNECGGVNYNYSDVRRSVIPEYQNFFNNYPKLKILVYSGDVDGIVPYPGTKMWIDQLNQTQIKPWTPWEVSGQVGGYATIYEKFTFTTVRNAGHQVPTYQPERAWHMFSSFLTGKPF